MATRIQNKAPFKHKKLVIALIAILLVVAGSGVTAAAYAGFVPGLTEAMKTNEPADLGVRYSAADFQQIQTSTNNTTLNVANFDGAPKNVSAVAPGKNLVIYGANTTQISLSQEELTAFLNMLPWTGTPLHNSQVRLSEGNTLEFSGNVSAAYVSDLLKTLYPSNNYGNLGFVAKLASHLTNPAVYAKLSLSSDTNGDPNQGVLHLHVLSLRVNRMDLTDNIKNMSAITVTTGHGSESLGLPYSVSSLAISNGKLVYYGTAPAVFAVGDGDPSQICSNYHGGSVLSLSSTNGHIGSIVTGCK